ncbi:hypothetical protein ACTXL8_05420 [Glutamicibacter arilaitensis]|uniref:hypothetical protein n=1 Tax=Glutamicibacter arilaitensis TaxID=256701 RepID=UPI003FD53F44
MTWEQLGLVCQSYVGGLLIWMGLALVALFVATTTVVPTAGARRQVSKWASRMFLLAWAWPAVLLVGLLAGVGRASQYLVDTANFEELWKGKK